MNKFVTMLSLCGAAGAALAAPLKLNIDPTHTYPSFAADHQGGISIWRGKFNTTRGTVVLDREAKSGSVDIVVDTSSIDFGYDKMNDRAKSDILFDVEKYPTATYQGTFTGFRGNSPSEVSGNLTLHGVTKPVTLIVNSFLCQPHAVTKKLQCGADVSATFNRADFGMDFGKQLGFAMTVKLEIQVETVPAE